MRAQLHGWQAQQSMAGPPNSIVMQRRSIRLQETGVHVRVPVML